MPLFFLFIGVFCGREDILTGIFERVIINKRAFHQALIYKNFRSEGALMMKKENKLVLAAVILTAIVVIGRILLLAVGIFGVLQNYQTDYAAFYEEADSEKICSRNSYSALGKSIITNGGSNGKTTNVSVKKLNGILAISETKAEDETVRFEISSNLEEGKMRIFVIKNDSEVLQEVAVNRDVVLEYRSDGKNTYTIKILAVDAKLKVSINVK